MLVAGRVLQPWHVDGSRPIDRMASTEAGYVDEFMGGNFSVKRDAAIALGGFDARFVRVAYRFEAEFAHRARKAGWRIPFVPGATIHHLRAERGGTRSYGDHLRTMSPGHAVGLYYFLLRTRPRGWWWQLLYAPFRAVTTRFHLRHPWWIVPVLVAQFGGLAWAVSLHVRGPALISSATSDAA
jgi:GT2 family glycosyltransferase